MNSIFQLLNPSNTLTVNRPLAHSIGVMEAMIYAALISKSSYYERNGMLDDGWFYSTIPDLEESTTLSEYQQKRCIKKLAEIGLIETKTRGLPARRCFRVIENLSLITKLLSDGEKAIANIKPMAAQSYERKRKSSCSEESAELGDDSSDEKDINRHTCSEETAELVPKESTELAPEELTPQLQSNCGTYSEVCPTPYIYKSKENKSKVNNHLSINHTHTGDFDDEGDFFEDMIDRIDEQQSSDVDVLEERAEYLDILRTNIDYECLIAGSPTKTDRIDEILNIMLDVVCSAREYIRVNGEDYPQKVVKSQFLKLNDSHIEYVLMAFDRNTSSIRNIRSYLITALYNAPHTIGSFYSAMVNHDMYGNN